MIVMIFTFFFFQPLGDVRVLRIKVERSYSYINKQRSLLNLQCFGGTLEHFVVIVLSGWYFFLQKKL